MSTLNALNKIEKMMAAEVGVHESPAGSNRQKYGAYFHDNGVAWCAIHICWLFVMMGWLALIGGFNDYTVAMAQWFYNHGLWGTKPKRGAIGFMNFGNPNAMGRWKGIHHVVYVLGVLPDGRVVTHEGNTSQSSDDNGGEVQVRYRNPSFFAGYGYPKYPVDPPAVMLTVPNVVNVSGATAVKIIQRAGFKTKVESGDYRSIPKYVIAKQSPAAGASFAKGGTVVLTESTGVYYAAHH